MSFRTSARSSLACQTALDKISLSAGRARVVARAEWRECNIGRRELHYRNDRAAAAGWLAGMRSGEMEMECSANEMIWQQQQDPAGRCAISHTPARSSSLSRSADDSPCADKCANVMPSCPLQFFYTSPPSSSSSSSLGCPNLKTVGVR